MYTLETADDLFLGCLRRCAWPRRLGCARRASRHKAITYSARLASRLPWRLRRWRIVLPEDAGIGAAPHRWANAASSLSRSGLPLGGDQKRGCRVGADTLHGQQFRRGLSDQPVKLLVELGNLLGEPLAAPRRTQRELGGRLHLRRIRARPQPGGFSRGASPWRGRTVRSLTLRARW